jgi:AcrR family transcriptional regulator
MPSDSASPDAASPAAADEHAAAELPLGLVLAWTGSQLGRRGPRPARSVAEIVRASIELADAGGIDALSMPNIAQRLDFTPNALYRYVRSKDELLVLVADAAWRELPSAVLAAPTWRDAATAWVHGILARYHEHPWLLDVPIRGAPLTPGPLGWLEALLAALAGTGLGRQDQMGCAMLLDGYARGTAVLARNLRGNAGRPGGQPEPAVGAFLAPLLSARFPILAGMLAAGGYGDDELSADDVDFGLTRILDGIGMLIRSVDAGVPPAD